MRKKDVDLGDDLVKMGIFESGRQLAVSVSIQRTKGH